MELAAKAMTAEARRVVNLSHHSLIPEEVFPGGYLQQVVLNLTIPRRAMAS